MGLKNLLAGYYDSYYDDYYNAVDNAVKEANRMYTIYWVIVAIVFLALAVLLFAWVVNDVIKGKKSVKRQIEVNGRMQALMAQKGLLPTRIFYFCNKYTYSKPDGCKQMLAVDSERNLLWLVDYESESYSVESFSAVLNYEVYENGSMVASGIGVGGLLAGGFAAQVSHKCNELRLIIRLKSADKPQVVYNIIGSKGFMNFGIHKNSKVYRNCFPAVQEAVSLLQVIIDKNKSENQS
ncbi:MAG: hypothetical protein K2G96_01325 [Clostridia bacterium]|nr:hypothetical protein [Clostridia bacterium]